ncbi:DUF1800 family protein [Piscinibacter sp.]|uniref:DUF1800 domain-containing protein n=1 Tax=Piscinibacter sp. TaxID=1903157 RepID=UPI003559C025
MNTVPVMVARPSGVARGMRWLCAGVAAAALAACGNGGSTTGTTPDVAPSTSEASRFLAQATFGPTDASIAALTQQTYGAWLADQFAKPQVLHRSYMDEVAATLAAIGASTTASNFYESWWTQAVTGPDQLRQRATFALSQVFVVSFADATLGNYPRGVASYYDMLGEHAFGNYRDLLEAVTLHPMMGSYLSMLRNQKEDAASGRVPDENYAREVMQLFSIGLYELNPDGTVKTDANGKPIETYTQDDISGLAKVFTGWSWYAGPNLSDRSRSRFFGNFGAGEGLERDWRPMQPYNNYANNTDFHSASVKTFLGQTIAAQSAPDPEGDLKVALDTLFNHPNVGPFIGRQLIQRMVTSNPSPAYVGRVAARFNDNGSGVRGDMKAVWSAVLLDPEARAVNLADAGYGKLREPVLRLANFLRAFKATSTSGRFLSIDNTDDPAARLAQTPMRSPSVFNYFRPGYTPPNSSIATAGLVSPEMQLASEVSVAGYLNYLRGWVGVNATRDVQQDYSAETALADNPDALVERVNGLLMAGQMSDALRAQIVASVAGRVVPAVTQDAGGNVTNQAAIDSAQRDRVCIAVFLTMASPDYLTQK